MTRVKRRGTYRVGAEDFADRAVVAHFLIRFDVTQRGGREDGNVVFFAELEEIEHVAERAAHGLVDEERLFRGDNRLGLLKMNAAVDAFKENSVDVLDELFDRLVDG